MTLEECIAYLENVLAKKKPRSRKARQILKYLYELKRRRMNDDTTDGIIINGMNRWC